jgi:hypothetical protein
MVVLDADGNPTRVTGVVHGVKPSSDYRGVSGTAWIRPTPRCVWQQCVGIAPTITGTGTETEPWISLFTEAGTFYLDVLGMPVRDFSDIGIDQLHEETEWIRDRLAKIRVTD